MTDSERLEGLWCQFDDLYKLWVRSKISNKETGYRLCRILTEIIRIEKKKLRGA